MNTAIGMGTAYVDSSAVLLLTGDTHVHMKGVGVLQEIERFQDSNLIRALEPLSKRSWRVESVAQLPRIMKRAFNLMQNGRSGPVTISVPMDVQSEELDVAISDQPEYCLKKPQEISFDRGRWIDERSKKAGHSGGGRSIKV